MREDGGDGEAAGAFDVHEEGAGGGDESLLRLSASDCGGMAKLMKMKGIP